MGYTETDIQGWMSIAELQWLFETAGQVESIVEIGCWRGRSTHALLSGCKGTVYAVDHFKGSPSERGAAHSPAMHNDISIDFLGNVGHFTNLNLLKMSSIDAVKLFKPKSIDMIFIDGSHDYEDFNADLNGWLSICKKIICGHDNTYPGVRRALKESGLEVRDEIEAIWSIRL